MDVWSELVVPNDYDKDVFFRAETGVAGVSVYVHIAEVLVYVETAPNKQ